MYLSGANALVSREKLIALGGFNEIFAPFYSEDFELSLRTWRSGWKCYYEHNAICRHRTSTTIKQKSSKIFIKKIYNRNKMLLHAIHLEPGQRFLWQLQLIPETIMQILLGRFWFLSSLRMYLASGKKIKASRKKFKETATTEDQIMTTGRVIKNILHSLSQIPIKRF
jgi:GT2 family glycosyltransferase